MDKTQNDFTINFVFAQINYNKNHNNINTNAWILIYVKHEGIISLSNMKNLGVFTASFHTLFILRIKGHISTISGSKNAEIYLKVCGQLAFVSYSLTCLLFVIYFSTFHI